MRQVTVSGQDRARPEPQAHNSEAVDREQRRYYAEPRFPVVIPAGYRSDDDAYGPADWNPGYRRDQCRYVHYSCLSVTGGVRVWGSITEMPSAAWLSAVSPS